MHCSSAGNRPGQGFSTFLVDPGNFTYDASRWRSHFVDSPSHNVVLVDGAPQRRRGRPRPEYAIKEPARVVG